MNAVSSSGSGLKTNLTSIDRILVADDFSEFSLRAVQSALVLARRHGAELHHVHVAEKAKDEESALSSESEIKRQLASTLNGAADALGLDDVDELTDEIEIHHVVLRGRAPGPAMLKYVYENKIDLVVAGTHGRTGLRRLILGSVAEELIHHAPCPVLTLRDRPLKSDIERLLVPVDFSEDSAKALSLARVISEKTGSEIDLLHVIEDLPTPSFFGDEVGSIYDLAPDLEERAMDHLKEMWADAEGPETAYVPIAESGPTAPTITDVAEERGDEAIVIATHGRTGLDRFVLGSVADKVVRSADCPVLVVRTRETTPIQRVHLREEVLDSDWYAELSDEDQELVRYFVGRSAEVLSHSDEETKLVLNMVAMNNRYIHVPNEFISEFS